MTRAAEIQRQISELQLELKGLAPIDSMTVREVAKIADISPATAARIKGGDHNHALETVKKVLPLLSTCPCCGEKVKT